MAGSLNQGYYKWNELSEVQQERAIDLWLGDTKEREGAHSRYNAEDELSVSEYAFNDESVRVGFECEWEKR